MPLKLPSFRARRDVYPPDLWTKCPTCSTMLFNKQLDKHLRVCTSCGHHFRLSATARIEHLTDHGSWHERDADLQSIDALGFVDQKTYPDRIAAAQLATGMRDAALWGTATIADRPIGGLGVFLTTALASDVAYERRDGANVLTVTKRL